jgi:crotonobetainyl-CoA:carnitine CoA-transferase CaiB-like acyl-CoA transferase
MLLADHGAEVTRIEPPGGDPFRAQSGYRVWNRGKRSAILDLKDAAGRERLCALASRADVFIESFSPGTTDRLGIGFEALRAANPRLVYCSITGYGRGNRHSDRPAYDALVMARTGLHWEQKGWLGGPMEHILGREGPNPGIGAPAGMVRGADREGPTFVRSTWPSLGAAFLASVGVSAALFARERTGRGQWVETSLLQGALAAEALNWQRVANPDAPLYWMWVLDRRSIEGLFECADGRWVHQWTLRPMFVLQAAEADVLRAPETVYDYRTDPDRIGMGPEDLVAITHYFPELARAFGKFPSRDWLDVATRSGMGMALVQSPDEVLRDPALLADGCVVEVNDPEHGRIRHAGVLCDFADTPARVGGPAPQPGAHTAEVVAEATRIAQERRVEEMPARPAHHLAPPLDGIRVLDLGIGVAGPFAGKLFADLGAEVVKVHTVYDGFWTGTHMGLGTNRGKRSIAINLRTDTGREILEKLIAGADVVHHNWRPGAAARLGIDHASLRERWPRLVYCNTRGFEKGPRSLLPGTDQTANALSGTEWEDGGCHHGNPPLWSRSGMGDTGNAFLSVVAVLQALYHRERTGRGQEVSTSILNACLLNTSYAWVSADGAAAPWRRIDARQLGLSALYRLYETAEGWLCLAAVSDDHWHRLCAALDRGDLTHDPRFARATARNQNDAVLAAILELAFLTRPAARWFQLLDAGDVPCEIVSPTFCREWLDDPDLRARGWVAETWAAGVGKFEDPGLLVDLSLTPGRVQRGPCIAGQHTREILRELGYSDGKIDELCAQGAVLDSPIVPPARDARAGS